VSSDRSVRFLDALRGASTSRVLNLYRIARDNQNNPEHGDKPLFRAPLINRAFIVKHRARSDETYLFASPRATATKIIQPFDEEDLRAGGRSLFVDQRGFRDAFRQMGNYAAEAMERDYTVLRLLDRVPSLDPFLLREHLRNNEIDVADCYFAISQGDQERMHRFVSGELARLVALAGAARGSDSANRLVAAMLSSRVDEKLEPLRVTLGLTGNDFREGVFSWRGFLYYKWSMESFWPDVMGVLRHIGSIQPFGPVTPEQRVFLGSVRQNIIRMVRANGEDISRALAVYDSSFSDLVANQAPKAFRDFLLSAPYMFLDLGEKLGAISHIVSFWRYRFPPGSPMLVDAEELSAIFQDFSSGFGDRLRDEPALRRPTVLRA
jgi:hypothetical protein